MKFLAALMRLFTIACIWTPGYLFWYRRLTVGLWGFNILAKAHWIYIWDQWQQEWVIQTPREWCFVIALFMLVPLWFIGWTILCSISWVSWFKAILLFPIKLLKSLKKKSAKSSARPKVTRKKSYKQTRPPAVRASSGKIKPIDKAPEEEAPKHNAKKHNHAEKHESNPEPKRESRPAPAPSHSSSASGGSISEILSKAGYRLISDVKISGKTVDYVGVADDHLLLCLVDSEAGDWLADEERFNDEEPLWFSESNHRISPVRVILNARDALLPKLTGKARGLDVRPMVVVKQGTIINAEDMFEVWEGLHVSVCRFQDGGPAEIKPVNDAVSRVDPPDDGLFRDVSSVLS